ncbi:hypothetical protein WR25_05444 [Diploscapter pachys]|uniref:Uncharacterized protein n=1 Tax=Diploscapter pachys TaxID=2018661 RepID=A0A2A2JWP0_9BILA|nr:hypothetical protein WR25_05444 [Diploscapter pachys]
MARPRQLSWVEEVSAIANEHRQLRGRAVTSGCQRGRPPPHLHDLARQYLEVGLSPVLRHDHRASLAGDERQAASRRDIADGVARQHDGDSGHHGDVVFADGEFEIDEIDLGFDRCATKRNSLVGIERTSGHDHQAGVHDLVAEQELGNGSDMGADMGGLVGVHGLSSLFHPHHGDHIDLPIPLFFSPPP